LQNLFLQEPCPLNVQSSQCLHHKIYLGNPLEPLESFSISDGFNILFLNRIVNGEKAVFRSGIGLVFAHMDVSMKERKRFFLNGGISGAYISGVSIQGSVEKWLYESQRHFVNVESKLTLSYVRPPVSDNSEEYAEINNIAIHFLLGFGSKPLDTNNHSYKNHIKYWMFPAIHHYLLGQGKLGLVQK
jgi:hypothetical protein